MVTEKPKIVLVLYALCDLAESSNVEIDEKIETIWEDLCMHDTYRAILP